MVTLYLKEASDIWGIGDIPTECGGINRGGHPEGAANNILSLTYVDVTAAYTHMHNIEFNTICMFMMFVSTASHVQL